MKEHSKDEYEPPYLRFYAFSQLDGSLHLSPSYVWLLFHTKVKSLNANKARKRLLGPGGDCIIPLRDYAGTKKFGPERNQLFPKSSNSYLALCWYFLLQNKLGTNGDVQGRLEPHMCGHPMPTGSTDVPQPKGGRCLRPAPLDPSLVGTAWQVRPTTHL